MALFKESKGALNRLGSLLLKTETMTADPETQIRKIIQGIYFDLSYLVNTTN